MSKDELMKIRQQEHEERKKMRVEKLQEAQVIEPTDPVIKQDQETIKEQRVKSEVTIQILKNDNESQKDALRKRLAERK